MGSSRPADQQGRRFDGRRRERGLPAAELAGGARRLDQPRRHRWACDPGRFGSRRPAILCARASGRNDLQRGHQRLGTAVGGAHRSGQRRTSRVEAAKISDPAALRRRRRRSDARPDGMSRHHLWAERIAPAPGQGLFGRARFRCRVGLGCAGRSAIGCRTGQRLSMHWLWPRGWRSQRGQAINAVGRTTPKPALYEDAGVVIVHAAICQRTPGRHARRLLERTQFLGRERGRRAWGRRDTLYRALAGAKARESR